MDEEAEKNKPRKMKIKKAESTKPSQKKNTERSQFTGLGKNLMQQFRNMCLSYSDRSV